MICDIEYARMYCLLLLAICDLYVLFIGIDFYPLIEHYVTGGADYLLFSLLLMHASMVGSTSSSLSYRKLGFLLLVDGHHQPSAPFVLLVINSNSNERKQT